MTTRDLIEELKKLPQDIPILMSMDDEGNGYRELPTGWVSVGSYERYDYDIEVGISELTDELRGEGYTEEDVKEYKCVVIG